eukprot:SAG22_NODE_1558_length_4129_cov_2.138213_5_plen_212_part_00
MIFDSTALEDIKSGQEVYYDYGSKGNGRLLPTYGFAVEGNPDDYYSVHFVIRDTSLALAQSKRGMLAHCQLPHRCVDIDGGTGSGQDGATGAVPAGAFEWGGNGEDVTETAAATAAANPSKVHHTLVGPLPLVLPNRNEEGSDEISGQGNSGISYVLLAMSIAVVGVYRGGEDRGAPAVEEMAAALDEVEDIEVASKLRTELEVRNTTGPS